MVVDPKTTKFDAEKIKLQLQKWQEKLLDMSKSNPLLGLNRARSVKFKIFSPDHLEFFNKIVQNESELKLPFVKRKINKKADSLFEDATEEKYVYEIEPGDIDLEANTPADLRRKLKRLYDNARTTLEERGVITLYLTLGAIHWDDEILGESISPLILVPCEFVYKGPNAAMRLKMSDEDLQLNPALIYYYREKHMIDIPELPSELDQESLNKFFKEIDRIVVGHNWSLSEETWIGTFNFESLVLYKDLQLLVEQACSNSVIAALAHALNREPEASEALSEDLDSLKVPEVVPIPILPADSSQIKALTYTSSNEHLVIHGPPGTGKSQTISNIIADALGKNKKILFVSAKMAALNVVFTRLKKEGLGQFCLEAHGIKAGKLKIIEDLKRSLESDESNNGVSLKQELESLQKTRKELNDYVAVLHEKVKPFNKSVYQAIGRYSKLKKTPSIKGLVPWNDILDVSADDLNSRLEALEELIKNRELFDDRKNHALRGFSHLDYNLQAQEKLEDDLKYLVGQCSDFTTTLKKLEVLLSVRNFSFEDLRLITPALDALSKVSKLPKDWPSLPISSIEKKRDLFKEAAILAEEFDEKKKSYSVFCEIPVNVTLEILSDIDKRFDSIFSRISLSYFQWRKIVKGKLKPGVKLGFKDLKNYHQSTIRLFEIEGWFDKQKLKLEEEVKGEELSDTTALQEAADQADAAIMLKSCFSTYQWEKSKLFDVDPEVSNAAAALVTSFNGSIDAMSMVLKRLDESWPLGLAKESTATANCSLEIVFARCTEVLNNLDQLRDWVMLQKHMKHCEDLGLTQFINAFSSNNSSDLPTAFEKRFLTLWIDANISRVPSLADFSNLRQEELISKLKILDSRIRRLANLHSRASAALASRGVKHAQSGLGNGSEIGILRFEMQKRKRIKPLRKLFSEIPHVLQALKPCMMMSPVSVSTYLKPESFHFDLVLFDEASQLPTQEAIPSILRAEQVIVAGDPHQLPPTSFFDTALFNEDDNTDDDEPFQASLESLLDDCVASVPVFRETHLKWHYRSREEKLISFSNHYFYENRLITFPSPAVDQEGQGVTLEYVADGVWDRGRSRTNRREARRAAQLAIEHFSKYPERSLGIVTLNSSQKEAIEDSINEELTNRPDLLPFFDTSKEDAFFVKSLENVQGDERDTMIISIAYGKSSDGALTLNFGPINAESGWRRLNVLVTRARWQIILITSLRSAELHKINPQNRGAVSLKNFIEYCERKGSLPADPAKVVEIETNDFEDTVRELLVDNGFIVDPQVGAGSFRIDLGIRDPRDPSRYLMGIECDGATYHSSKVARDRDLIREEILKSMGWKLHRVWSTEWFRNRDAAIKLMLNDIDRALKIDSSKSMPAATIIEEGDFEFKSIPAPKISKKYKPGIPYLKYNRHFQKDYLIKSSKRDRLQEILEEIIKFEGPIHDDVLEERVKEVFKVQKIGANIRSNLDTAIKSGISDKSLTRKKQFIWSNEVDLETFRIPGDGVKRTLRLISPHEIALAVLYVVEDQFGIMRDYLPQAAAKILEDARMDPDEVDIVRNIADHLIENGILVANGNQVNLA